MKAQEISKIKLELENLTDSPLFPYRHEHSFQPVIGEGSYDSKIMFIGEAPGKKEAESGRPFCGAAGRVLDQLLESINLDRKTVYITNIVNDRPPENRDPTKQEIELYSQFLDRQIQILQPKIIATLGRFSMKHIMERFNLHDKLGPISKIHGQKFIAQTTYGEVLIVPLYHPAAALYNGSMRPTLMADFQLIKEVL